MSFPTQAIVTKYLCPTNTRGSRYKATCQRGSITVSAAIELNKDDNHALARHALCKKFAAEDKAKYGSDAKYTWLRPWVTGVLPSGEYVHVQENKA